MTPNCTSSVGVIHIQLMEMKAFRRIWKVNLNFFNIKNKINPLMAHE